MQLYYVWVMFQKIFQLITRNRMGIYEYVYDFLVDYNSTDLNDVLNIHKYLMVKNKVTNVLAYETSICCIIEF